MNIEGLSRDDADLVQRVLVAATGGGVDDDGASYTAEEIGQLTTIIGLLAPPLRANAVVKDLTYTHGLFSQRVSRDPYCHYRYTSEDKAEAARQAIYNPEPFFVAPLPEPETVTALACGHCEGIDFTYVEDVTDWRTTYPEADRKILFIGDSDFGDGNDSPGLVCDTCGRLIDLPDDWEVEYA